MGSHRLGPAPETTVNCSGPGHAPRLSADPGDTITVASLGVRGVHAILPDGLLTTPGRQR